MADKFILLHPNDYARAKAERLPVEGGSPVITGDFGIPLVRDHFGVCKSGQGFEVDMPPYRWKPSLKFQDTFVEQVSRFRYQPLRLPDPRKFIALGTCEPVRCTLVVRLSLKKRAKAQRRLDRSSNVRRCKRRAELRARKRYPMPSRSVTYCSFANETGCLGVVVLRGRLDIVDAAKLCHAIGENPGGQMVAVKYDEAGFAPRVFKAMWKNRNRLIPAKEARRLFSAKSIREWERDA